MNSYSQNGEDKIIRDVLGDAPGTLLDIGAWDPSSLSNSRALIEAGWSAILIEPSPRPLAALAAAYEGNERVTVIQAVVALEPLALIRLRITDDAVSAIHGSANEAAWSERGGYYGTIWAATLTLPELFNQFGSGFAFVNIDTEGISVDLARAYLESGAAPRCMCVEHDGRMVELAQVSEPRGYVVRHLNGENAILERR